MKILAIDSSGLVASVALIENETMVVEYTVNYKKTHSQTLLPMIDEIVQMIHLDMSTIDAIAIAKGPGSFTGLRIGAGTVKGLALALDIPIIPISTIEGLAANIATSSSLICPLMDARRNQVYTGIYESIKGDIQNVYPEEAMDILDIIKEINKLNRDIIFLGDGVEVYKTVIDEHLQVKYQYAPLHMNRQSAGALGMLAVKYYQEGKVISSDEFVPNYLRVPQAERELAEKQNNIN